MKKFLFLCLTALLMLSGCSEIEDRLDNLEQAVDEIRNTQIATLQEQVNAINATLPELEKTDKELKGYIENLQTTANNLQKSNVYNLSE